MPFNTHPPESILYATGRMVYLFLHWRITGEISTTVPVVPVKSGFRLPFIAHLSSLHHADYYLYSEMRAHFFRNPVRPGSGR
jgi:hypothetical protein